MSSASTAAQSQTPSGIALQPMLQQFLETAARAGAQPVAMAISPSGEVVPITEALKPAAAKLPDSYEEIQREAEQKSGLRKLVEALFARLVALLRRVFLGVSEIRLSQENLDALNLEGVQVKNTPATQQLFQQLATALQNPEFVKSLAESLPAEVRQADGQRELTNTARVKKALASNPNALEKASDAGLEKVGDLVLNELESLTEAHRTARAEYEAALATAAAAQRCSTEGFVDAMAIVGDRKKLDPDSLFSNARLRLESVERERAQAREIVRDVITKLDERGRNTESLIGRLVAVSRAVAAPVSVAATPGDSESEKPAPAQAQNQSLVQRASANASKFFAGLELALSSQAVHGASGTPSAHRPGPEAGMAPAG